MPYCILKEITELGGPFGTSHRNPDILKRVLNQIVLSNSTVGKCALMQVIKQPEHGRISLIEEQK